MTPSTCRLSIVDLRVGTRIGCTAAERECMQTLSISVEVLFDHAVLAMSTDELSDTCCYAIVSSKICELASRLECRLIEYFAAKVHSCVSDLIANGSVRANLIEVKIQKIHPPVVHLGSASFVYSAPPVTMSS